jgi:hypothetical protein
MTRGHGRPIAFGQGSCDPKDKQETKPGHPTRPTHSSWSLHCNNWACLLCRRQTQAPTSDLCRAGAEFSGRPDLLRFIDNGLVSRTCRFFIAERVTFDLYLNVDSEYWIVSRKHLKLKCSTLYDMEEICKEMWDLRFSQYDVSCLIFGAVLRCFIQLDYMAQNGSKIHKWWIGKDLEAWYWPNRDTRERQ